LACELSNLFQPDTLFISTWKNLALPELGTAQPQLVSQGNVFLCFLKKKLQMSVLTKAEH
jgi:hypothetical protein